VETRAVCELTQNRSPLCVETRRSVAGPFPLLFRDMSFRDSRHSCIMYRPSSRHPLCGTATGLSSLSPPSFCTLSYTGYRLIPLRLRRCLFIYRLLQQRVAGEQRLHRLRGYRLPIVRQLMNPFVRKIEIFPTSPLAKRIASTTRTRGEKTGKPLVIRGGINLPLRSGDT